jgi:glycosyltransferase involved in cell wall biosynthesis
MNGPSLDQAMRRAGACVIIPAYNNGQFLEGVLEEVLGYTSAVVVVDDGSTDDTRAVLERYHRRVEVVSYRPNRGKGHALRRGFDRAAALGYRHAITMDADGQHAAADLPRFLEALEARPGAMIVGSRRLRQENMPGRNTFANRFSNFWFAVQTGRVLPDTQCGFRLYPLAWARGTRAFTGRYEAELELLARAAWRGVPLVPVPVRARYLPAGERVSHFRPGVDFARISALNACLVVVAIVYGYPSRFVRYLFKKR